MAENGVFDPHLILSRLRSAQNPPRDKNGYDKNIPPPFPEKPVETFPERPDTFVEMETEIKELSAEVSRLKLANKQLQNDKRLLESQLSEQKERSESIVAKLRSNFSLFCFLFLVCL